MGRHVPPLGEQLSVPGSASQDEARGRTDEQDHPSVGYQETDLKSEYRARTGGDLAAIICVVVLLWMIRIIFLL